MIRGRDESEETVIRHVEGENLKKKQLEGEKGGERAVLKGKYECEKRRGRLVRVVVQQEDVWLHR